MKTIWCWDVEPYDESDISDWDEFIRYRAHCIRCETARNLHYPKEYPNQNQLLIPPPDDKNVDRELMLKLKEYKDSGLSVRWIVAQAFDFVRNETYHDALDGHKKQATINKIRREQITKTGCPELRSAFRAEGREEEVEAIISDIHDRDIARLLSFTNSNGWRDWAFLCLLEHMKARKYRPPRVKNQRRGVATGGRCEEIAAFYRLVMPPSFGSVSGDAVRSAIDRIKAKEGTAKNPFKTRKPN